MPTGEQSRSDSALRAEELRLAPTNLTALCALLGKADELHDAADAAATKRAFNGFRRFQRASYEALCEANIQMLDVLPQRGGADILILAGHVAMMADCLCDQAAEGSHMYRVFYGISQALVAISGTLAEHDPQMVATISALNPELGRSIRRDIATVEAFRADQEGA
jgi:hypothetical protein